MRPYFYIKRILDFIFAFILIVILSPIFLIIAIAIKIDSKGPVFFKQERLGKGAKLIKIYKFRTMVEGAEHMGSGIYTDSTDPRITRVGGVLRKTSIDELPQAINILRGEMSFVGPRPAPDSLSKKFDVRNAKRLMIRPGITGWAQVNGRNLLTWHEKIEKDIWYIENLTFLLDVKIVFRTIKCVFIRRGVYSGKYSSVVRQNTKHIKGEVKAK